MMDFLDPKKKRAHNIRLYIGYLLMGIALTIGTFVLLFEAYGFDFNRQTGEVIQNGLIFVDAHPEQAQVFMNGKREGDTDMRLTVPAGEYNIRLHRAGYRDWQRTFILEGSIIERLNYAFLFPEQLDTSDIQLYASAPGFATQSPDRKWVIAQQPGKLETFDITNIGEANPPTAQIVIPTGILTPAAGTHALELAEWSTDNRHFIVKHTYKGGSEFVRIDRERPGESLNLSKHFNIPLAQVAMRDKKFDKLHLLDTKGNLRFADTKSKQVTQLAAKVSAYKSYSDDILVYTTDDTAPADKTFVMVRRGDKVTKLRDLPKSKLYLVDITKYEDEWFIGVGTDTEKRAYIYHQPFKVMDQNPPQLPAPVAVLKLDKVPQHMSISANTRFIGVQAGSEFATYDAEHNRTFRYDTNLKLPIGYKATWMDGHRYAVVSDNKLIVFDYDGINMQTLSNAHPAFTPFFDRDYDNLFTLGASVQVANRIALTKTPMRIPSER